MSFWRWNLHATVAVLSVSPLVLGWGWGLPLSPTPDGAAALVAARAQADAARVDAGPPAEDEQPLIERVAVYRVERGDTLNLLAQRFNISVDTLLWANPLPDPNRLLAGQELTVLPVSGVLHRVSRSDTLANVAERYGSTPARLAEANGLTESHALSVNQRLLVPDGRPLPPTRLAQVEWPAPGTGDRFKRQFIEASAVAAQESYRRIGIPVSVAIAQAIHESYWGTSGLARNANNFFGIKARNGEGSAGVYWMDAWEVIDGGNVVIREPFRAYNSPDESFIDHGLFFLRNNRYHRAFRFTDDPRAFAEAIADAGYATDPAYAAKLIRIMDQFDLYQYDVR